MYIHRERERGGEGKEVRGGASYSEKKKKPAGHRLRRAV